MTSDKDYAAMDRDEIARQIRRLKDELEDMEDTFTFNLTNTSAHLRSGIVAEHEDELAELKKQIAALEALLVN